MSLREDIAQVFRDGLGMEPTEKMVSDEAARLDENVGYGSSWFNTFLNRADPLELIKVGRNAAMTELSGDAFDQIYREVLGREPDAAGKKFWKGHYEAGRMTLGEVITKVEQSDEALGK